MKDKIKAWVIFLIWCLIVAFFLFVLSFYIFSKPNFIEWGPYQLSVFVILFLLGLYFLISYFREIFVGFSKNWLDKTLVGVIIWDLLWVYIPMPGIEWENHQKNTLIALVFVGLSLVILLIRVLLGLLEKKKKKPKIEFEPIFISDEPIETIGEDTLGRENFAITLAEAIVRGKFNDGFVIGINGSWGYGKSSFLNMIKDSLVGTNIFESEETELSDRVKSLRQQVVIQKTKIMEFDPWYFNSKDELLEQFFGLIENELKNLVAPTEKYKLRPLFSEYVRPQLSFAVQPEIRFPGFSIQSNALTTENRENLVDLKKRIQEFLANLDTKIVVFVDNIDRLGSSELILMLKLVRLCSNFPNIVFLLAFDKAQVKDLLKNGGEIDPTFLEKIIQVDIDLPSISLEDIDRVFENGLKQLAIQHSIDLVPKFWEKFSEAYQGYIRGKLLTNLRNTKRILNGILFSLPIIKGEVNYEDFITLEFIRVFFPKIYIEIPNFREHLTAYDQIYRGTDYSRQDRLEAFSNFSEWVTKNVPGGNNRLVKTANGLIGSLFPLFQAYISNPANPTDITYDGFAETHARNLNICSSLHFSKYFCLQVPPGEIPTYVINQIVNTLNEAQNIDRGIEQFTILFEKHKDTGQLENLLSRLRLYTDQINEEGKVILVSTLSKISNIISWEWQTNIFIIEARTAVFLISDCFETFENIQKLQNLVETTVATTPSLPFACYFLGYIIDRGVINWRVGGDLDIDSIKEKLHERIQIEILEPNINILEVYPEMYVYILPSWRSVSRLNAKKEADEYLYGTLEQAPEYIPKLLASQLSFILGTDQPADLRFEDLQEAYDVDLLFQIIEESNISKGFTDIETFALEEFIRIHEQQP